MSLEGSQSWRRSECHLLKIHGNFQFVPIPLQYCLIILISYYCIQIFLLYTSLPVLCDNNFWTILTKKFPWLKQTTIWGKLFGNYRSITSLIFCFSSSFTRNSRINKNGSNIFDREQRSNVLKESLLLLGLLLLFLFSISRDRLKN